MTWSSVGRSNNLDLLGDSKDAEWRVLDIYQCNGDKLVVNWVFIDMVHYLKCRGLDVLGRMREVAVLVNMLSAGELVFYFILSF